MNNNIQKHSPFTVSVCRHWGGGILSCSKSYYFGGIMSEIQCRIIKQCLKYGKPNNLHCLPASPISSPQKRPPRGANDYTTATTLCVMLAVDPLQYSRPHSRLTRIMPGFHYSGCRFAVPVSRCRFRTPLPLPLHIVFAVYGCNGTKFSDVIFTEQRNFTAAERRNGNGMVETGH